MTRRDKGPAPVPPPTPGGTKHDVVSTLAAFDDLMRCNRVLLDSSEEQFLQFVQCQENCRKRWQSAEVEIDRLQSELVRAEQEVRGLELKLNQARDLVNVEMTGRKKAEIERDNLNEKFAVVRDFILTDGGGNLNDETRQKLRFLESSFPAAGTSRASRVGVSGVFSPVNNLSVVNEIDSTGSILDASDLSFDMTCDPTADESRLRSGRTYKRKSSGVGAAKRKSKKSRSIGDRLSAGRQILPSEEPTIEAVAKPRRSSGRVQKNEPVTYNERNIDQFIPSAPPADLVTGGDATNCWVAAHALTPQESSRRLDQSPGTTPYTPGPGVRRTYSNAGNLRSRKHIFIQKTVLKPETCGPCGRRIKFGKVCLKCRDCKATTHQECKDQVPLPCVALAAGRTPTRGGAGGSIADYTPLAAPMVPALVVHCVNEVETRGLGEVGLYRVPGSEREVKELKEKFMKGKGCPSLAKYDIHVICGCIKDFLRGLKEPIIPHSMWNMFTNAATNPDINDGMSSLYQAISELPQPNRDTLAFMMLHLQKVSDCVESKMPASNLSKILGPTILGYSCPEPNPTAMLAETGLQSIAMEKLIGIDSDYWGSYVNDDQAVTPSSRMIHSPNTPEPMFAPIAPATGLTPQMRQEARFRSSSRSQKNIFSSPMLL